MKIEPFGECFVMFSVDAGMEHLSISHKDRLPTWDELHEARYKYMSPSITVAMLLPPKNQYVNLHQFCFHLWQLNEGEVTPLGE